MAFLCLGACALGLIFIGCKTTTVLEEGGHYANLPSGELIFKGDELARDYHSTLESFDEWARHYPMIIADSETLTAIKASVDRQLTPPADLDEPLQVYYTARDAYVAIQSDLNENNLESQIALIEAAMIQLLQILNSPE